ncbi:MAG: serine/threonine-protein kinase [Byssovorax sp.]
MPGPKESADPPIGGSRDMAITVRVSAGKVVPPVRVCESCGARDIDAAAPCPLCGARVPALAKAMIVDGRYRIDVELGRGGMGVVYLAKEMWLDRKVALKIIAPSWAGNEGAAVGFHREAKALASVRSDHVVQVYSFGLHEGSYFFAMEYIHGRSLRKILAEHREHGDTIPLSRALTIITQIAQGIDAVHAAGMIHRDVKPSNILIEDDTGRPVLVDFGLAVSDDESAEALLMGTPQCMAPEQTGLGPPGVRVTPRTDVYALGCTAFEMLTGRLPFVDTDQNQLLRQHARRIPPLLSSINKALAPFDAIIAKALAKDPAQRFETCTAMAAALSAASERARLGHLTSRPPPMPIEVDPVLRVLVIDQDAVVRRVAGQAVALAFSQHPKNPRVIVTAVESSELALERAQVEPPDLVLLDYDMPNLDGTELLSRLRATPGCERVRVIVLSGRIARDERWRFSVLGVRDFVNKPIDLVELVQSLLGVARRYGRRDSGMMDAVDPISSGGFRSVRPDPGPDSNPMTSSRRGGRLDVAVDAPVSSTGRGM